MAQHPQVSTLEWCELQRGETTALKAMKRTQSTLSDDAQNEQTKRRNTHPRQQECTLDTGIGSKAPTKHKTIQRGKEITRNCHGYNSYPR